MNNTTLPPDSDSAPVAPAADPPADSGPHPEPGSCPPFTDSSFQLAFPRSPGETPRAYSAFMTFFLLDHGRSLQAVADKLGEGLPTVKNWSSRFNWSHRVQAFYSGLLQQQVQNEAALRRQRAADWAARLDHFREQEWDAAQKLLAAARCFLESFGDEDLHKMSLAQVSRALEISSSIGRLALAGAEISDPANAPLAPVQQQLLQAVSRVYGQAAADRNPSRALASAEPPTAANSIGSPNELPSTEVGPPRRDGRGQEDDSLPGNDVCQSL